MENNYFIYHLHSDFSNAFTTMDSVTKYHMYIEKAKELGMKALAFSEHGSILSWTKKKETIEKNGMKYVHAIEAYVTEDSSTDDKHRDNYHVVLIAKNWYGVVEINKLSSKSFCKTDEHFFHNPRITYEELKATSDNIIICTACIGGILYKGNDELKDDFIKFLIKNKHRAFLEIQHHSVESQSEYNKFLYKLSLEYGIKLVAGTDTHSLNDDYADGRKLLQKLKNIHFANEDGWDSTMKSYDELVECYRKQGALSPSIYLEAINNTNLIVDMVEEFKLDKTNKYPKLYDESEKIFKQKINQGWKRRDIKSKENVQEYTDRLMYEFATMKKNGSIDYLLLEEKIKTAMAKQGVFSAPSRGSSSGSLVAYLLGVTDMDSIKYNLNFERFMNSERVSLCDIDSDWSPEQRPAVKKFIHDIEGVYTSEIITFNTIALKGSIRDIGSALDMPKYQIDDISKNAEAKEAEYRAKYPELFRYVDLLMGTIVSIGAHPAATIVSPIPLDESMGIFYSTTCEYPIAQINMKEVDDLNFVKLDVLGLANIGIINTACELAGIDRLTPDNVDFDDDKVWDNIIKSPTGIFQFEEDYAHSYLKQVLSHYKMFKEKLGGITRIDLMSVANGAIRPAGESYREDIAKGKIKDNGNEALNKLMSSTIGQLTYQEQIIEFMHRFCGFTMGKSDLIRKGFAKKTGTEQYIPEIKEGFIKTMTEQYGMTKDKAEHDIVAFLQVIEDASSYLFSLNHSQSYSFIGYFTAYLRTYHPLEFIISCLKFNQDDLAKTAKFVEYANKFANVNILPPKFRFSKSDYSINPDRTAIYKGVYSIKSFGEGVGESLYELRNNKYDSFVEALPDLLNAVGDSKLQILIKLDFFSEFGKSQYLLDVLKYYDGLGTSKVISKGKFPQEIEAIIAKYSRQTEKQFRDFDASAILSEVIAKIENRSISIKEMLEAQKEYLGYISINLDTDSNNCIVLSIDTKYSPKLKLMSLLSGNVIEAKIYKEQLAELEEMDIVRVIDLKKEDGWKLAEDGKWVKNPLVKVWRLKKFMKISEGQL